MEHSFDIDIARKYGITEAVLLKHFYFWIEKNRVNNHNFFDGYYWTYNSRKAYTELFPYLSEHQVRYTLDKLVKEGILITGNYNKVPYDRTLWYAITEKGYSILKNKQIDLRKFTNESDEFGRPIPDINTDNKEIYKEILDQEDKSSLSSDDDDTTSPNGSSSPLTPQGELLGKGSTDVECLEEDESSEDKPKKESKLEIQAYNFNILWGMYPRKLGKAKAFKHYRAWRNGKDYCGEKITLSNEEMEDAINAYKKEIKDKKMSEEFIKHGSTFFNNDIYDYVLRSKEKEQW